MSLKKKYIKNSFYNVIGWGWIIVLNIMTIPYIVHKLGYDAYGILVLVLLVLGYFAFLDFGLGDAVIKYISHYYTLKDFRKINRIINSILFLFIIIGLIGGGLIVLFTRFFALKIFKIPMQLQSTAVYCFYLGAIGFFLNLIFGVISKIPEALQRFDLSNRNNVITGTTITLSNVLVLFLGHGLKEVVIVNILGSALGISLFYVTDKKLIPQLTFNLKFDFRDFREIFQFGLYTIFTRFSGIITNSINQLFVGFLIGTTGVAIFSVPFKIVSKFQGFIYRLAFIIFPVSSELLAQKDLEKLQNVYLKLSKYVFLLSSIFFVPLIAYSNKILFYWMGADFASKGTYLMTMISLTFYLISLTMVPGLVALGLGKPRYNAFFSFLTATINMVFIYPLTKMWGINGAAIALLLSSLQVPVAIYVINKKVVEINTKRYFSFVFGKLILFNIVAFIFYNLILNRLITNLLTFLLIVFVSYGFLAILFYKIGLAKDDKKIFIDKFVDIKSKIFPLRK